MVYLVLFWHLVLFNSVMVQNPFHIWFERSGGFTGITLSMELENNDLESDEAGEVEDLIDQSGFFALQEKDSLSSEAPDQFQYKITIEYKGKKKTVEMTESAVSGGLRPLINYLNRKARTKR